MIRTVLFWKIFCPGQKNFRKGFAKLKYRWLQSSRLKMSRYSLFCVYPKISLKCILYSLYKLVLSQHNKSSYHQFSIWTLSITVYFVQHSLLILPMLYIQLHFLLIRNNLFLPSIKKILLYNLHHTFQEYILLHPSYDLI